MTELETEGIETTEIETTDNSYLIPDKVYTVLKWLAMLGIPALSAFVQTLGAIWGFDLAEPIALTITAVGAFLGALVGVSAYRNYRNYRA